jgi:hypothetical protein
MAYRLFDREKLYCYIIIVMPKIKIFFILLLLVLCYAPFKGKAASTGCYGLYMGNYYLVTSVMSGTVYNSSPNIQNPGSGYCIANIGGTCTVSGFSGYVGNLVSYNPAANGCPIDDEIQYLLLSAAVLGFFIIKRHFARVLVP